MQNNIKEIKVNSDEVIKQVDKIAVDVTLENNAKKTLLFEFNGGNVERDNTSIEFRYGEQSKCILTFDFRRYELKIIEHKEK